MGYAECVETFPDAWTHSFVSDKFGAATTHWRKLMDRIHRGVGNPCPLLLVGMPASLVSFDPTAVLEPEPEGWSADNGD